MKNNSLVVIINRPIQEVFYFTTDPTNTPLWIDSIVKETVDTADIKEGTIYENWNAAGESNKYSVFRFNPPKVFELRAIDQDYSVRYTYRFISVNQTELVYQEWSQVEDLQSPFTQEILNKLKLIIESRQN